MPASTNGEAKLKIGDLVISLSPADPCERFAIDDLHLPFISTASPPDITLRVHYESAPRLEPSSLLFESGATWSLYGAQEKLVYVITSGFSPTPCQIAVLDADFLQGDVYCPNEPRHAPHLFPLGYPLEELLVVNLLARGRGVLLHACGINNNGQGLLFSGPSGAGKSTLSRLWEKEHGVKVLSDDRVIVRKRDGRLWMYGTPWHGEARFASPESAPLDRVFVIRQAAHNNIAPLKPAETIASLLVRSFPPFWSAPGVAFTLDLLGQLSQQVPCYLLDFLPDRSIVDKVQCQPT